MKKVLVLFIVGFVLFGSCSAQNVNAQSSNDAQRIVGTWKPEGLSLTFTFNANGTYTLSGVYEETRHAGNYFVSNSTIFLRETGSAALSSSLNYNLSSDGRVLVFRYSWIDTEGRFRDQTYWFIKQ